MTLPSDGLKAARWLAWQAVTAGRLELAQILLDGCAAADPHDRWCAQTRTEVALARGDAPRAHAAATAWMAAAPRDGAAARACARAFFLIRDRDTAYGWLRKAADLGDDVAKRLLTRMTA